MSDTEQPEALRMAEALEADELPAWPSRMRTAEELRRLHAENETLRHKLKTLEDLGKAGEDVHLLRMGYAAARLEIESLSAQLEAVGAGGVGAMVAAPAQPSAQSQDALEAICRALCVIGVVGVLDGHDVIRRDSVLDIASRHACAAQKETK